MGNVETSALAFGELAVTVFFAYILVRFVVRLVRRSILRIRKSRSPANQASSGAPKEVTDA